LAWHVLFQVAINITDENVRPFFNQTFDFEVEENTKIPVLLIKVFALDKKKNEEVICKCTYRLMPGIHNPKDSFVCV
jgi:hypothetical protein